MVATGPIEYTQVNETESKLITRNFSNGINKNEFYSIRVAIESIGVVRTKTKEIGWT